MKKLIIICFSFIIFSCQSNNNNLDALNQQENNTYKPGFGEMMSNIQHHHIKLWFAGINNNWELAKFEIHELDEGFEDIEKYKKDKTETKQISIIKPSLKNMKNVIENNDSINFKTTYSELTTNCNNCHLATKQGFIKIKIPTYNPFSNQEFEK